MTVWRNALHVRRIRRSVGIWIVSLCRAPCPPARSGLANSDRWTKQSHVAHCDYIAQSVMAVRVCIFVAFPFLAGWAARIARMYTLRCRELRVFKHLVRRCGFQPHLPLIHVATWRSLLQKDAVSNSMEYNSSVKPGSCGFNGRKSCRENFRCQSIANFARDCPMAIRTCIDLHFTGMSGYTR